MVDRKASLECAEVALARANEAQTNTQYAYWVGRARKYNDAFERDKVRRAYKAEELRQGLEKEAARMAKCAEARRLRAESA